MQKRHFIETDIKEIRKAHGKIHTAIKKIGEWQKTHEKDDAARFAEIATAISKLPTEQAITDAVAQSVQRTVNGKIDDIKAHLTHQDENLELLSKKIKPIDGARAWLRETGQFIMYLGGLALAITGLIELLKLIGVIK